MCESRFKSNEAVICLGNGNLYKVDTKKMKGLGMSFGDKGYVRNMCAFKYKNKEYLMVVG